MAFKKTLVQRLFNLSRFSNPSLSRNPAVGKPPLMQSDPTRPEIAPDPGETGNRLRRIMQRRPLYQSARLPDGIRLFPPAGDKLVEKLRGMDIARDRIRLEGLVAAYPAAREEEAGGLSVIEVRKVLKASQVEMIRAQLREIERDSISYGEFLKICEENCGGNKEQALGFAKMLDDSGSVIVLGNAVCLRPHQVAKAIHNLISDPNDPRRKELEQMEERKAEIDRKAERLVRREMWAGLGYLVAQTAAFMRLTFWELSWDVMEPICFYVTSVYFMAAYAFFLRTLKEPSFEGFFQSRFSAKQNRLFNTYNFDLERYNQLKKAFYPHHSSSSPSPSFHHHHPNEMIMFDSHHKIDH